MTVQTKSPGGITKHLFDVTEYHRFADAGIFMEDDRVELINGEVVEMSPIGSLHAACVKRLAELLHEKLGKTALIGAQDPIQLDDFSEPEPDLSILKPRKNYYADAHPRPTDVLLLIEVSDTTIEYDRSVKLPLYARTEIPETWVVDLNGETIEQFSAPRDGQYTSYRVVRRAETLTSISLPTLTLSVDEILG